MIRNYLLALHIIFVVTWFAGLFYLPRLFIYSVEADEMEEPKRSILKERYLVMMRSLWNIIMVPSSVLTFIFGGSLLYLYWIMHIPGWLWWKLSFLVLLYAYHFACRHLILQMKQGIYKYTSQQLRIWNEVATLLLFAIVFLVMLKNSMDMMLGLAGLIVLGVLLMLGIKWYKNFRQKA